MPRFKLITSHIQISSITIRPATFTDLSALLMLLYFIFAKNLPVKCRLHLSNVKFRVSHHHVYNRRLTNNIQQCVNTFMMYFCIKFHTPVTNGISLKLMLKKLSHYCHIVILNFIHKESFKNRSFQDPKLVVLVALVLLSPHTFAMWWLCYY
jgi:hypothetical protein